MEQCPHDHEQECRRVYTNGIEHVVVQCQTCGVHLRNVAKSNYSPSELARLPWWDEDLRQRWYEQRQREFEDRRGQITREYRDYLQSDTWRRQRNKRLAMDGGRCQAQLDGCTGHATEVHHLDYRLRPEPLFNLVSVCRSCHHAISVMEGRISEDPLAS